MYYFSSKKRILIIDDDPHMLRTMKTMLEGNYEVAIAPSGMKGIRMINKFNPDIILLDYDMPDMNGQETFAKIKEDEMYRHIPVMFLTGIDDEQMARRVLKMIPAGYVLKPPVKSEIIKRIEAVLK